MRKPLKCASQKKAYYGITTVVDQNSSIYYSFKIEIINPQTVQIISDNINAKQFTNMSGLLSVNDQQIT